MNLDVLNELLTFIESEYHANSPIMESGQRKVYLANKKNCNKKYVLKVCPILPVLVARIKREIRVLSETDSEYFPKFHYDFFVTDEVITDFIDNFDPKTHQERIDEFRNTKPFLVTVEEYIENIPWKNCIERLKQEPIFLEFLTHLFAGLNHLWEKKIVHRDLKPDNILIRPDFRPVIIDLGIAKSMRDGATALTHPGLPSPCTPGFAAPEQLLNHKTEVTYKSDQFSIGVISFLIFTNRFPYGDESQIGVEGVVSNFLSGKIENFRNHNAIVSDGLAALIQKLLMIQPYQRFRTRNDITEALVKIKETL
jgi:serine/threonine-protein kinase